MKRNDFFAALICLIISSTSSLYGQTSSSYSANADAIFGSRNVAFGIDALKTNYTGHNNVATGYSSLFSNLDGSSNVANGDRALYSNTFGNYNVACGSNALYLNTTGGSNVALGYQALYSNTTGHTNIASGDGALRSNTTGFANIASSFSSLYGNTTGSYNIALGRQSLTSNTVGSSNLALGDKAGYYSVGNNNIFLGKNAGYYETGDYRLYIGSDSNKTIIYGDMQTGQVLMGSKQPSGYTFKGTRTLNVVGGILTDSIRLAPVGDWADYVFSDKYVLRPLPEVEQFIKVNQHLPGIPSGAEVGQKGINLAEINTKLLEKVEELTLYLLQQQKQLDEQKKTAEQQQREIDELKKLLKAK